ncbi:hypothetical protein CAAN1_33S00408 [[Candida] anglica]
MSFICRCRAAHRLLAPSSFFHTMNVLLSSQETGGIRVVRITPALRILPRTELCREGKSNYIQKIVSFSYGGKGYLALARRSGLVQLYEREQAPATTPPRDVNVTANVTATATATATSYKLYKEWKHSNHSHVDPIVAMGFVCQRYLYSCSGEGKLIFRDLVNDDDDDSYMVLQVQAPVSCVDVKRGRDHDPLSVVCAGKGNGVKVYRVKLRGGGGGGVGRHVGEGRSEGQGQDCVEDDDDNATEGGEGPGNETMSVPATATAPAPLAFAFAAPGSSFPTINPFSIFVYPAMATSSSGSRSLGYQKQPHLSPSWSSQTAGREPSHSHAATSASATDATATDATATDATAAASSQKSNWIVSVCFVQVNDHHHHQHSLLLCGTQFGCLLAYAPADPRPVRAVQLSQFGIVKLQPFEHQGCNYVLFTDCMSKVGVLNVWTFEVVNLWHDIAMGGISAGVFIVDMSSAGSGAGRGGGARRSAGPSPGEGHCVGPGSSARSVSGESIPRQRKKASTASGPRSASGAACRPRREESSHGPTAASRRSAGPSPGEGHCVGLGSSTRSFYAACSLRQKSRTTVLSGSSTRRNEGIPAGCCSVQDGPPGVDVSEPGRKINRLSGSTTYNPIYFITSSMEGQTLAVYKLYNDNHKEMIGELPVGSLVPSLCVTGGENGYLYRTLSGGGGALTGAGEVGSYSVQKRRNSGGYREGPCPHLPG